MQKSCKDQIPSSNNSSKSVTASKKTYENLWKLLFLGITIISAILFNKIYEYQTMKIFDEVRKGEFINLIIYCLPFSVLFTIFDLGVHYYFDDLCEKYYINHQTYTDPIARKNRCYTLVKWGYSLIYYSLSYIAAIILLKDTNYFPSWLGGNGSPMNIYNDYPQNSQFSFEIQVFYILQFGKHLSRTFSHLFIRPQGNYYEYALHHGLSIFLIFFSYTMDQWLIGSFVLLIHDFTDFTLILARGYRQFRYKNQTTLKCLYILGFSTWILCRVVIFSNAFIYSLWISIFTVLSVKLQKLSKQFTDVMFMPICFMAGMLAVLQGLQLFWTYYIIKSYISVNVSAKLAKHTYD